MLLLGGPISPYVRIVRMAAMQRGIDHLFETRMVPTRVPDSPVLEYNPTGKIPTLVLDSGIALSEVRQICEYLDTLHDGKPIAPLTPDDATRALEGVAVGFLDGVAVWVREARRPASEQSPDILAQERARADRCIAYLNARVAQLGEPDTYATLCVLIALWRLGLSLPEFAWRAGVPALTEWYQRGASRPEFDATLPP